MVVQWRRGLLRFSTGSWGDDMAFKTFLPIDTITTTAEVSTIEFSNPYPDLPWSRYDHLVIRGEAKLTGSSAASNSVYMQTNFGFTGGSVYSNPSTGIVASSSTTMITNQDGGICTFESWWHNQNSGSEYKGFHSFASGVWPYYTVAMVAGHSNSTNATLYLRVVTSKPFLPGATVTLYGIEAF